MRMLVCMRIKAILYICNQDEGVNLPLAQRL